ncbi:MAG TPA: alpha/beta hydrolase [Actinophytocola sp.]|nr:alpha/beta hydrolase [Actinophytocola sp.]
MGESSPAEEDNPWLLLLHAAGFGRGSWDPVLERIPGFVRALAIDLPGHGDVPGVAYDREVVPRLADYVGARIAELGLRRPHVVGHSLGGAVAFELARRAPVAAVTTFCSTGFRSAVRARACSVRIRTTMFVASGLGTRGRERMLDRPVFRRMMMSPLSARPSSLGAEVVAGDVAGMVGSDLVALSRYGGGYAVRGLDRLATTPVNLVWADQDRVVPLSDSARARQRIPQAVHMVIPGSGHLVMRDDPGGTAAIVLACHARLMRGDRWRGA